MNSKERLLKPRDLNAMEPMAARAVALCEGCPVAKFCVIKAVAPCETPVQQEAQIESGGGGYEGPVLDKPVRTSYRNELFDMSKKLVMAEVQKLQKPKEIARPKPQPISHPSNQVVVPQKKVIRPSVAPVKQVPHRMERSGEGGAGILAGIIASMIGVKDSTS
jgi:hypothetical protein